MGWFGKDEEKITSKKKQEKKLDENEKNIQDLRKEEEQLLGFARKIHEEIERLERIKFLNIMNPIEEFEKLFNKKYSGQLYPSGENCDDQKLIDAHKEFGIAARKLKLAIKNKHKFD